VLVEREDIVAVGVQVGIEAPFGRLLLFSCAIGPAYDRFVGERTRFGRG